MPLHDEKVTVWCGVSAKTAIGPFFFHDDQFFDASYSSKAYATVLVSTRRPPPHTSRITIDFLKKLFPGRLMSKSGDLDRPPRSTDLTPSDFFLWNIREEIAAIPAEMLAKTMENGAWVRRIWATLILGTNNRKRARPRTFSKLWSA